MQKQPGRKKNRPVRGYEPAQVGLPKYQPPSHFSKYEFPDWSFKERKEQAEEIKILRMQNHRAKHGRVREDVNMKYNKAFGQYSAVKLREDGKDMGSRLAAMMRLNGAEDYEKNNARFNNTFGSTEGRPAGQNQDNDFYEEMAYDDYYDAPPRSSSRGTFPCPTFRTRSGPHRTTRF